MWHIGGGGGGAAHFVQWNIVCVRMMQQLFLFKRSFYPVFTLYYSLSRYLSTCHFYPLPTQLQCVPGSALKRRQRWKSNSNHSRCKLDPVQVYRGAPQRAPPSNHIFLNFMQFLGNFNKIVSFGCTLFFRLTWRREKCLWSRTPSSDSCCSSCSYSRSSSSPSLGSASTSSSASPSCACTFSSCCTPSYRNSTADRRRTYTASTQPHPSIC